MSFLTAVLLGLVQGLTEFLPVSSSGHLALLADIFQLQETGGFYDAMVHLGTLGALLFALRKETGAALRGGLGLLGMGTGKGRTNRRNYGARRLAVYLIVGTLPLFLSLPLRQVVAPLGGSGVFISLAIMVSGLILYLTDRYFGGMRDLSGTTLPQVLLVGLCQALAVMPGISRVGTATSAGLLCGFKREYAVELALLLSIPALAGMVLLGLIGGIAQGITPLMAAHGLVGMLASAVSGYGALRLFQYLSGHRRLDGLAYYCWGAGFVGLVLSLIA